MSENFGGVDTCLHKNLGTLSPFKKTDLKLSTTFFLLLFFFLPNNDSELSELSGHETVHSTHTVWDLFLNIFSGPYLAG